MSSQDVIAVATARMRLTPQFIAEALGLDAATAETYQHPTPTEPEISDYVLETYTRAGDRVLDPMCGTGTIVERALRLGRDAYGSDVVEEYVRLVNARIESASGLVGRVRLHSALQLRDLEAQFGAQPYTLCFFSPPLLKIGRDPYPRSEDQVGNYEAAEQVQWLNDVCRVAEGAARLLREGGYLAIVWRNQRCGDVILANVQLGVARLAGGGPYELVDEKLAVFANQGERPAEVVNVFRLRSGRSEG